MCGTAIVEADPASWEASVGGIALRATTPQEPIPEDPTL
jgi:hypothetical protein